MDDLLYYVKKFEEEKFDVDFAALKEYLPLSLILQGIFKILQDSFGNKQIIIINRDPNFLFYIYQRSKCRSCSSVHICLMLHLMNMVSNE